VAQLSDRVCAIPLAYVIEIMRELPIAPLVGVPAYVRGVSIIRGIPTPVVDLGAFLGTPQRGGGRFVSLRAGERRVALSVDAVHGVRDINLSSLLQVPPLLHGASGEMIESMDSLDTEFLTILKSGWQLPDEVWCALAAQEAVL
jgi:purine-binding chemotaxis protein CheW